MLLLIAIIFILSGLSDIQRGNDIEYMERNAERRHRELMENQKELSRTKHRKRVKRYAIKDPQGFTYAQEIIDSMEDD